MTDTTDSIASEVLAASLGGAVSASILYPLEVIKTKMQAVDNTTAANDDGSSKDENEADSSSTSLVVGSRSMIPFAQHLHQTQGASVFFRGIEAAAFRSALEKALYFFSYTSLKRVHKMLSKGAPLSTLSNLILGYAADWAHLPISLPMDAWTTEIQTRQDDGRAPLQILLTMLGDKNRNFYKGLSAYYLLCFRPALQYTVYEQVKAAWLKPRNRKSLSLTESFLLGMIARAVATVILFPFVRAKVLLQTHKQGDDKAGDNGSSSPASSTLQVLWQQWKLEGLLGLYRGAGPELTRGVLSAALMLMVKERIVGTVHKLLVSPEMTR